MHYWLLSDAYPFTGKGGLACRPLWFVAAIIIVPHELQDMFSWFTQKEPLDVIAIICCQQGQLFFRLNPFGENFELQGFPKAGDRANNRIRVRPRRQIPNKRLVNFNSVKRECVEVF